MSETYPEPMLCKSVKHRGICDRKQSGVGSQESEVGSGES